MKELDWDKFIGYSDLMKRLMQKARDSKSFAGKVETVGMISEACKELIDDFETWIQENEFEIDEKIEAEIQPKSKSLKKKFVPVIVKDDDDDDDEDDSFSREDLDRLK